MALEIPRPTNEKIIEVVNKCAGIKLACAKSFGISRPLFDKWVKGDKEIDEALEAARECLVDIAESELVKNVQKGKEASIFFALKTIGKKRGYQETKEVEFKDKPNINITYGDGEE